MNERSPLPWRTANLEGRPQQLIVAGEFECVGEVYWHSLDRPNDTEREKAQDANAEFIVRACNSHEELLDAVKLLLAALDEGHADWIEKAHSRGIAAIAKAEGRES